jgi:hypothetical protein
MPARQPWSVKSAPLPALEHCRVFPTTLKQEREFTSSPGGIPSENVFLAASLRSPYSPGHSARILSAIIQRHEALRTTLHASASRVVQAVHPAAQSRIRIVDLRRSRKPARALATTLMTALENPFDQSQLPLVRPYVLALRSHTTILALVLPHSLSDGVARAVFHKEVAAHYAAPMWENVRPLPAQLRDLARWDRASHAPGLRHWKDHLAGLSVRDIAPITKGGVGLQQYTEKAIVAERLAAGLWRRVEERARLCGVPTGVAVVTVLGAALVARAPSRTIVIGLSHRNRWEPGADQLLASLFDVVPLRLRFEDGERLEHSFRAVHAQLRESEAHRVPWALARDLLGSMMDVGLNFYRDRRQPATVVAGHLGGGATQLDEYMPWHERRVRFPVSKPWWGCHVTVDVRPTAAGSVGLHAAFNPAVPGPEVARLLDDLRTGLLRLALGHATTIDDLLLGTAWRSSAT